MPTLFPDKPLFTDVREAIQAFESQALKEADRRTDHGTRLQIYHQTEDKFISPMFFHITTVASKACEIPKRGTNAYAQWLDALWKGEPILAGAVYSMVAKMQSMNWKVEGGRNNASAVSEMLARARYMWGFDWAGFIGSTAVDFYTQDNGFFWDTARGSEWGVITDLAHIDTRNCILTGNANKPMYYRSSITDDEHWYRPDEYIHAASMVLPQEREMGIGYCAVSRAAKAAKLLMALHNYDSEKLSNLPPEGVASVTGLTDREFRQAIAMWMAERRKNNSLTFPQVLWLVSSNPGAKVAVDMTSFSSIPESFDRETVVQQYVNTLALCFGVDAREFWTMSTAALGTAAETEVQHLKARGKGGGEFISIVESAINAEIPDNVSFKFDTQDIEEDMVNAEYAKMVVDAYIQLVYAPRWAPEAKPMLDMETFKRILADKGVLPEWAVGDGRVSVTAHEIHKDQVKQALEDIIRVVWEVGKLKEVTLVTLAPPVARKKEALPRGNGHTLSEVAETEESNIRGTPIAESEVERGTRVTATAVRSVYDMWGDEIPELTMYVPLEQ
jgi:hypothetical protein